MTQLFDCLQIRKLSHKTYRNLYNMNVLATTRKLCNFSEMCKDVNVLIFAADTSGRAV